MRLRTAIMSIIALAALAGCGGYTASDRVREDPRFRAGLERIRTQVYAHLQRAKLTVGPK